MLLSHRTPPNFVTRQLYIPIFLLHLPVCVSSPPAAPTSRLPPCSLDGFEFAVLQYLALDVVVPEGLSELSELGDCSIHFSPIGFSFILDRFNNTYVIKTTTKEAIGRI